MRELIRAEAAAAWRQAARRSPTREIVDRCILRAGQRRRADPGGGHRRESRRHRRHLVQRLWFPPASRRADVPCRRHRAASRSPRRCARSRSVRTQATGRPPRCSPSSRASNRPSRPGRLRVRSPDRRDRMQLQSYAAGSLAARQRADAACCVDATTGETVAEASSGGLDYRGDARPRARGRRPGAAGDDLSRARRRCCKALGKHLIELQGRVLRAVVRAPARPRPIPGSTSTAASARCSCSRARARANCRTAASTSTAPVEALSKGGSFVGQHICVPLEGAAVHINAFNFPVWGMLEKLAPALLAGRARDREAGDRRLRTSPSSCCAASSRSGLLPRGRAAADLRRRRRPVRSSRLPGRRRLHRLGDAPRRGCARIRP